MLTDGNLRLRPYRQDDRGALVKMANNINVSKYLTDRFPHPYTCEAAEHWIAGVCFEREPRSLAIEWQGQFVGGIGLTPYKDVYRQTAEIGYWLGEPFWGRGIATGALGLFLNYSFFQLGFIRLQAMIIAENKNSAKVLEKNGFVCEGVLRQCITKHGRVHDAMLYALLRDQPPG